MKNLSNLEIAVIGLGYVGLPLAVEFSKKFNVLGFDINKARVKELKLGTDSTLEVSDEELLIAKRLTFSRTVDKLKACNVYIVTVPTPIDEYKQPDLSPLIKASEMLGGVICPGDVVIYESTVYPGATEEVCIPVLEQVSGLTFNEDFFAGYSPERINPGDKTHRITNIVKVTSGSTAEIADFVDALYSSIITAGTHKASSIRVAEAAKVIENTQRDINIGLVNELALIFNKLGIDTEEVLIAAGTKWNFLPFRPGLVGGHCIGVDPYYLTSKAEAVGYHPEIILSGRRLNDSMARHASSYLVKEMLKRKLNVVGGKVLVLGVTFKENCPDTRNTKVVDLVNELVDFGVEVHCFDPWVNKKSAPEELTMTESPQFSFYDAVVVAVAHDQFKSIGAAGIRSYLLEKGIIFDLKYLFKKTDTDLRL
jgi:UDP-N-acetyl-D-galactosamine dehydrogenase